MPGSISLGLDHYVNPLSHALDTEIVSSSPLHQNITNCYHADVDMLD